MLRRCPKACQDNDHMPLPTSEPKVFGAFFKHEPSRMICQLYRWVWLGLYLVLFALKDSLPEKFSRDATLLAEMIESGTSDEGSYGAMAMIYSMVPGPLLPFLPVCVALPTLWIILGYVRSYPVMLLLPILFPPFLIMNFMNPTKETLVAILALFVYRIAKSRLSVLSAVALICVTYVVYAKFVRIYYFLIAAFFAGIWLTRVLPAAVTIGGAAIVLLLMAFLPSEVYETLQGPRDEAARFMEFSGHVVRTFFYNLMPPKDVIAFLVNTAWGVLVMLFPFVIAQSFNEALMMINVYFFLGMARATIKYKTGVGQLPAYLFFGHILTQAQFEPDLGSYVRHFSVMFVILAPGMQYMFRLKPADEIAQEDEKLPQETDDSTSLTTAR